MFGSLGFETFVEEVGTKLQYVGRLSLEDFAVQGIEFIGICRR